jgi:hypothetical protein
VTIRTCEHKYGPLVGCDRKTLKNAPDPDGAWRCWSHSTKPEIVEARLASARKARRTRYTAPAGDTPPPNVSPSTRRALTKLYDNLRTDSETYSLDAVGSLPGWAIKRSRHPDLSYTVTRDRWRYDFVGSRSETVRYLRRRWLPAAAEYLALDDANE